MKSRAKNFLLNKWGRHCIYYFSLRSTERTDWPRLPQGWFGDVVSGWVTIQQWGRGKQKWQVVDHSLAVRHQISMCILHPTYWKHSSSLPQRRQPRCNPLVALIQLRDQYFLSDPQVQWPVDKTVICSSLAPPTYTEHIMVDQKQEKNNKIFHLGK